MIQTNKISDEDIILAYNKTNSVWKAGEIVGLCGQTVHARLTKLGVINKMNLWTEEDNNTLLEKYQSYRDLGNLKILAKELGRTEQFISRKAKVLGLTDMSVAQEWMKHRGSQLSESAKNRILKYGHPKGFKGHIQSESARISISKSCKKMWGNQDHWINSEEHKQQLSDRMAKMQAEGRFKNNYSRTHSGTFIIGGKTHFYRSSWEVNIASYYDFLKTKGEIKEWEYEPDVFWFTEIKRGVRSYKPDFKITRNDNTQYYVEVKGWMDDKSKTKLNRMRIYYPNIEIEILASDRYNQIKKSSSIIPNWGAFEKEMNVQFVKCSIDGCDNKSHSKGYCRKHFYKIFGK